MDQADTLYLRASNWDDWFKFETSFYVSYVDKKGKEHSIGGTKIGRFGLRPAGAGEVPEEGYRRPNPPLSFVKLPAEFFSLGQDPSFYENLGEISPHTRDRALEALRDVAYDPALLARAEAEEVMRVSLLREVPLLTVRDQFARLARGGARLTPYSFRYKGKPVGDHAFELNFEVQPNSLPPSNIQVLIGRNGVGKSTLLNTLAKALVLRAQKAAKEGNRGTAKTGLDISNLVSVSFSAFDAFEPVSVPQDRTKGLSYHYVGLKKIAPKRDDSPIKDQAALSREMTMSARVCLQGARRLRWLRAISLLETDPIFAEADLADLIQEDDDEAFLDQLPALFRRLSSGHKIVLLTVTRLVETVEEKSLVLLDEPETHLHPPLLSAFIRSLSDLLTNRNGLAIVATHSPVVLQEVPRSCVWKLNRSGKIMTAVRPVLETFAENVGTLTDDVFGLEVTSTGFHRMLTDAANTYRQYELALAAFGGQLGAEGKALLRTRVALQNRDSSNHVAG
ncbi:AAA family ATPase [Pseudarthrobacter sp. R1]|uniref:AAA family ATPase n=1 Tax=Pseudarthrobacter sp. R1 TaxID=2944934 RepID=UPI00210D4794|nr:AAA family ATPase [Pseudarthrobacter sp. R1]MCQ6271009.1 AAA family ATPase [Pseudarthrobacter sp. R1]